MSVPTCDHLKEDGVFCNSPALKGRNYCYFHLNLRGRRLKAARARCGGDNPPLNLPFPEDMHAVQVSLAEILWGLAEGRIEHKTAGLMLYALQQASTNLNHTPGWQGAREAVPSSRPLRALNFPDFEQRFGLPRDIDLDAEPDATVPDEAPTSAPMGGPKLQGAPPLSSAVADDRVVLYRVNFDQLTEEQEHELLVNWLREKREEELDDPEFREERKKLNEYLEARHAQSKATPMGGPQLPSVGNCGDASAHEAA